MLNYTVTEYINGGENTTYMGHEFIDYSGFTIGGEQNHRVGKSAIPILIDGKVEGVMVWEERIDDKFAKRIIP